MNKFNLGEVMKAETKYLRDGNIIYNCETNEMEHFDSINSAKKKSRDIQQLAADTNKAYGKKNIPLGNAVNNVILVGKPNG